MTLADLPPATLLLRLDTAALADNWRALDRLSGRAETGAAVKADAYGLGAAQVVPVLRDAGCRKFLVAHWSEVPALLDLVPAQQISVLHGVTCLQDAQFAISSGVRPLINSLHQARIWTEAGGQTCHLMVDSGINRLGISMEGLGDPLIGALTVDILMSHLASADEDSPQNARQLARFRAATSQIGAQRRSLANSAGIALGAEYAFDLTRPGLALYGGIPRAELAEVIQQVAYPQAAVLQKRCIKAGDSVGYNAHFTAELDMQVATVSIGYADGFLRCRGAGIALQHGGQSLAILGRVSMDMVVVDCSQCPGVKEGDFLTIPFDLPEISASSGLSQYELLTTMGNRFGL